MAATIIQDRDLQWKLNTTNFVVEIQLNILDLLSKYIYNSATNSKTHNTKSF